MILILGAQNHLGIAWKSITQASDWIGSCLIAKSESTLNSESGKGAKFFGGQIFAPLSSNTPPKNGPFFSYFVRKARSNAPISRPVGIFFKNLYILLQFCVWAGGWADESTAHLDIRDAPTIWLKTVPKRAKTALFLVFWLGHRGYWREVYFLWLGL